MKFEEITLLDINELSNMYVETFNSPPWNDEWSIETASKRLYQMINCESFYGIKAYQQEILCGMILGSQEQFYNGIMFNIKEFCVKNEMRNKGIGTKILTEFEKN
nr:GNAT family N-acetyltransferase [Haloimpatiens lingqiaonensis]